MFAESKIAHQYLDGLKGIEIGPSAHNPFNIPGCLFVDQYQPDNTHGYGSEQTRLAGKIQQVDVIADASNLPFEDSSLDYIITSHLLEHIWDPIFCIKEWIRVLKPNGYILTIVPHRNRGLESDKTRDITSLNELIERNNNPDLNPNIDTHHNVFIKENLKELFEYCKTKTIEIEDPDQKVGNGILILSQKTEE